MTVQFQTVDEVLEDVLRKEGRFLNHPSDLGGPTMWGITERVARKHGFTGRMQDLPRHMAKQIYMQDYVIEPGFGRVMRENMAIAAEMVEAGVNVGTTWPARWLQQWLNLFNYQGKHYADIVVDGDIGPATIGALKAFLAKRGKKGEAVMVKSLNCDQGSRYKEISIARMANEDFVFGWMDNRVSL